MNAFVALIIIAVSWVITNRALLASTREPFRADKSTENRPATFPLPLGEGEKRIGEVNRPLGEVNGRVRPMFADWPQMSGTGDLRVAEEQ